MSDRLRNLLATIDRALYGQGSAGFSPAHELLVSGWMLALQKEIAEREAPPPVLEGALAEVVKHARAALSFVRLDAPEERQPSMSARLKGAASELDEAIASLEALALRGARPATRAEWLAVALDLAQDEGEATEGLARAVASLLPRLVEHESVRGALVKRVVGPWSFVRTEDPYEDWRRHSADGDYVADAAESDGQEDGQEGVFWRVWDRNRLVTHGHAPTIREAMLAADAALRAKGRILLGGLPDEVAAPAVTYELSVNTEPLTEALEQTAERIRRFIGADFGASQDRAGFVVIEQDERGRMRVVDRLPDEVALEGATATATVDEDLQTRSVACLVCGGSGLRTRGVVVEACPVCGGARTVPKSAPPGPAPGVEVRPERGEYQQEPFAPDDPQPDASWLQETTELSLDRWWYRGTVPPVDVSITGASALDALLSWLTRRLWLASWREVPSLRGSYTVEIVTRAPLDLGAREGM